MLLATPAARVMRPVPTRVEPGQPLAVAATRMTEHEIREIPVVSDGRLVGILTRSDLLPFRGHLEWTPVRSAMTGEPRSVAPETPVWEVTSLLLDLGFNAVPVARDGMLLGMIRRADLLRLLIEAGLPGGISREP